MYKFVNRDESSSVYTAVCDVLSSSEDQERWVRVGRDSERFNLILAERNRPPYARLGNTSYITRAIDLSIVKDFMMMMEYDDDSRTVHM
jgi:hypothetical protein